MGAGKIGCPDNLEHPEVAIYFSLSLNIDTPIPHGSKCFSTEVHTAVCEKNGGTALSGVDPGFLERGFIIIGVGFALLILSHFS